MGVRALPCAPNATKAHSKTALVNFILHGVGPKALRQLKSKSGKREVGFPKISKIGQNDVNFTTPCGISAESVKRVRLVRFRRATTPSSVLHVHRDAISLKHSARAAKSV
eukprot:3271301-Amphidinium_carterae.1